MTVVALVGSTRFQKEFQEVERDLTLAGHIALGLGVFSHRDFVDYNWHDDPFDFIPSLTSVVLAKIEMAEDVIVIDVDGYLGKATKIEIAFAKNQGKNIYYYSRIISKSFGVYSDALKHPVATCLECEEVIDVGLDGTYLYSDIHWALNKHMETLHSDKYAPVTNGDFWTNWVLKTETTEETDSDNAD